MCESLIKVTDIFTDNPEHERRITVNRSKNFSGKIFSIIFAMSGNTNSRRSSCIIRVFYEGLVFAETFACIMLRVEM